MDKYREIHVFPVKTLLKHTYLLDMKQGDVNGDGISDYIFLYGNKPDGPNGIFVNNITIIIQDGYSNKVETVNLKHNSGFDPGVYLGDFNRDGINEIKVNIDSKDNGGCGIYYIYSFKDNNLKELFKSESYSIIHKYNVAFSNSYKIDITSLTYNKKFSLDISHKKNDYLSKYYDSRGKLIKPIQGKVLNLGGLFPIISNELKNNFDLLAYRRIIGTSVDDTLGFIENLLTWNGKRFISSRMMISTFGSRLISSL